MRNQKTNLDLKKPLLRPVTVLFFLFLIACKPTYTVEKMGIDNLMQKMMEENRLPSLSIAVSHKGKIVASKAMGYADLENKVEASTKSVYRVGSISKSITATMVMLLHQNGKLDLNAQVQEYCGEFPDKGVPISSKQLLSHLAGIRHYDFDNIEEEYYSLTRYKSSSDAMSIFKEDSLAVLPGSEYHYSSYGYSVLGCVIENIEKTSFEAALSQHIFNNADMHQSTVDYPEQIIPFRVKCYETLKDGTWENTRPVDLSNKFPGGGVLSTPTDLVKFANQLLENKLLNADVLKEMWTPQLDSKGNSIDYALGWRVSEDGTEVYHGGSSAGGTAYLYILPKEQLVVAFACNSGEWSTSRHEFVQQVARLYTSK